MGEGVVVVLAEDGIEMRGGEGGLEGRSEMLFSSELRVDYISALICPLWFFLPAEKQLLVWLHVCVNICLNRAKHPKQFLYDTEKQDTFCYRAGRFFSVQPSTIKHG